MEVNYSELYTRWQSCVCCLMHTVQDIQHVQHALQLPCPIYWLHKSDVAVVPIMLLYAVCVVCSVETKESSLLLLDWTWTIRWAPRATLHYGDSTREKSHGAGKLKQEKCLRPCVMRKYKGYEKKAWWFEMWFILSKETNEEANRCIYSFHFKECSKILLFNITFQLWL